MASIIHRGLGDGYEFEPKPFPTNHDDLESWVWYYNNDNHKDTSTLLRQLDNQCKGEPDSNPTKRPVLQRLHRDMHYDQHLEPGKRRSLCVQSEKAATSLQHRLPCNKSSNLGGTPSHQQTCARIFQVDQGNHILRPFKLIFPQHFWKSQI